METLFPDVIAIFLQNLSKFIFSLFGLSIFSPINEREEERHNQIENKVSHVHNFLLGASRGRVED